MTTKDRTPEELKEKPTKELKAIIELPQKYSSNTIMHAKELLFEREQLINELSKNQKENNFEKELLNLVSKQQKDIKDMRNYMLFFVVITVLSIVIGVFSVLYFANNPTNPTFG